MAQVLFFPGYQTPLKRYQAYFPTLKLVTKANLNEIKVILCHSIGILYALEYCESHKIQPKIICMDGSYLTPEFIKDKPSEIQAIYDHYFSLNIDSSKYQIYMFRQIGRKHESFLYQIIYYSIECNQHYPYMNRKIRNQIVELLLE